MAIESFMYTASNSSEEVSKYNKKVCFDNDVHINFIKSTLKKSEYKDKDKYLEQKEYDKVTYKRFRMKVLIGTVLFLLAYSITSYYAKQNFPEYIRYKVTEAPYERGLKHYNNNNYSLAYKIFSNDLNKNNALAQNTLGNMYYSGQSVKKDYKKAIEYYEESANQNYNWAQYNLANMYYNGNGVKKDIKKAIQLYKLSASAGNKSAIKKLEEI
jgi:TPR repeat protein